MTGSPDTLRQLGASPKRRCVKPKRQDRRRPKGSGRCRRVPRRPVPGRSGRSGVHGAPTLACRGRILTPSSHRPPVAPRRPATVEFAVVSHAATHPPWPTRP